jgi:hypothetical protein
MEIALGSAGRAIFVIFVTIRQCSSSLDEMSDIGYG